MDKIIVGNEPFTVNAIARVIIKSPAYVRLTYNWTRLARRLHISEVEIKTLERRLTTSLTNDDDVLHDILYSWVANSGKKATLGVLCIAMEECRVRAISESLMTTFAVAVEDTKIEHASNSDGESFSLAEFLKPGDKFRAPPASLKKFLASPKAHLLAMECVDTKLSLERLLDTTNGVELVDPSEFNLIGTSKTLGILLLPSETNLQLENFLSEDNGSIKLILLHTQSQSTSLPNTHMQTKDDVEWKDLKPRYQKELLSLVKCSSGVQLQPDSELLSGSALALLVLGGGSETNNLLPDMVESHISDALETLEHSHYDTEELTEDLGQIGLKQLFPMWEYEVFRVRNYANQRILDHLVLVNLLKQAQSKYIFVNELVAQFCVAEFAIVIMSDQRVFNQVLYATRETEKKIGTFSVTVREFQNRTLALFVDYSLLHANVRSQQPFDTASDLCSIGIASVLGSHQNILQLAVSLGCNINDEMLVAACFGNLLTLDAVLVSYSATRGNVIHFRWNGLTLVHTAVLLKRTDIVIRLLNKHAFLPELKKDHMQNLMHICAEDTMDLNYSEILERIELIQFLHCQNGDLINAPCGEKNIVPMLAENVHLKLIEAMILLGAKITATDDDLRNLAHVSAKSCNEQQFHDVVQYLAHSGNEALLRARDADDNLPLHHAVWRLDLRDETLSLMWKAGVAIHSVDKCRHTLLHMAVIGGRSTEFIQRLVKCGVPVNETQWGGDTPLHNVCYFAHGNQAKVVRILLEAGADVNAKGDTGKTALWWATHGPNRTKTRPETIHMLKAMGGFVCADGKAFATEYVNI